MHDIPSFFFIPTIYDIKHDENLYLPCNVASHFSCFSYTFTRQICLGAVVWLNLDTITDVCLCSLKLNNKNRLAVDMKMLVSRKSKRN